MQKPIGLTGNGCIAWRIRSNVIPEVLAAQLYHEDKQISDRRQDEILMGTSPGTALETVQYRKPDLPDLCGISAFLQAHQQPSRSPSQRSEEDSIRHLTQVCADSITPKVRKNP